MKNCFFEEASNSLGETFIAEIFLRDGGLPQLVCKYLGIIYTDQVQGYQVLNLVILGTSYQIL